MHRFATKTTIELHGRSLEYVVAGSGSPTLVLINGAGGPIEGWHKVYGELAAMTTTFAYNRPGVGRSDKAVQPQTAARMTETLDALLAKARVPDPYVVIGHSFGGLIANLYARLHPQKVQAVVLLEATAPEDIAEQPRHESGLQRVVGKLLSFVAPPDPNHETVHAAQSSAELSASPPFPAVPLRVVTGCKPAMAWATSAEALAARARNQAGLVRLSPLAKHVKANRSGHFPQFTEPQLVVSTVAEVMHAKRVGHG